jgi:hypothetical protein
MSLAVCLKRALAVFGFGLGGQTRQPGVTFLGLRHQRLVLLLCHGANDNIEVRFGHSLIPEILSPDRGRAPVSVSTISHGYPPAGFH